jgi:hypothetical protein
MTPRRPALSPPVHQNGRKRSFALLGMILGTLSVALGSYGLSARVAAEAKEAERLERDNARLARKVDALTDELRVRMRLPQLQRWNDTGFRMNPVSAQQFLKSPADLGLYGPAALPQMARAPILVSAPAEAPATAAPAPPANVAPVPLPQVQPPGLVLAAASTPLAAPPPPDAPADPVPEAMP